MAITIERLVKRYGAVEALRGLSLEVRAGEVFGFLGPNGAGKTTTLRILAGLLRPTAGRAWIDGHDVTREPRLARAALTFVPETPHLFDGLTGAEFLAFIGDLYRVPTACQHQRLAELVDQFELSQYLGQAIGRLSHGTRQKLALAAALLPAPPNLLLDEPTVGLDPPAAYALKTLLRRHAAAGGTVFFSTHILELAEGLCDRVAILDRGQLLACGTLGELRCHHGDPTASLEAIFLALTRHERAAPR